MAHNGTGKTWDVASPADAEFVKDGAKEIRDLRIGAGGRLAKEHVAPATGASTYASSDSGGEHKPGSAVAFYNGSAPTTRPDATTALDNANDRGRLWMDSGVLKYWNGSAWTACAAAASYSVAVLSDVKSSGTSGGTFSAGSWQTRTLNTELDPSGIVTLAANAFTLAAGTYEIEAIAPCYAGNTHQARLYNVTDAAVTLLGSSEFASASSPFAQTSSIVRHIMTLAGSKVFRLEHRCETNAQFGRTTNTSFGTTNTYASVLIRKIA